MLSTLLLTLVAFVLALGPLVFFHELGHFLAAKRFGVSVPVFSIGFGPRLFGFRRRETDYRVSLVPLGGYVRMAGDEADESRTGADHEFLAKPRWQRLVIFVAGAAFNVVLAFLVMWLFFGIYGKVGQGRGLIYEVRAGSPAERAGLAYGDRIVSIGGRDVRNAESLQEAVTLELLLAPETVKPMVVERDGALVELEVETGRDPQDGVGDPGFASVWDTEGPLVIDRVVGDPAREAGFEPGDGILAAAGRRPIGSIEFQLAIRDSPGEPVDVTVLRDGREVDLRVVPREDAERGGVIGVEFRPPPRLALSVGQAASESLRTNVEWSKTVFVFVKRLFTRELSIDAVSGPIGIAQIARQAIVSGFGTFLTLLAFLSLQLGILNLLPIPVLDGGHILILLVEAVMRRELSERLKERVMQAGLAFLLLFMAFVVFKDVVKLF